MTSVSFLRHNSFFSPEDVAGKTLNIIGVGATGSWVGLLAAKMGWHQFRIWDLDLVESHNCPNQIYDLNQVGKKKVDAFEEKLLQFNPQVTVEKYPVFFEEELHMDLLTDAVFVAVDSINARRDIISNIKDNVEVDIIFETAVGFASSSINAFTPFDTSYIDSYLGTLKDEDEYEESACNARIITTLTSITASYLTHQLCDYYSSRRRKTSFILPKKNLLSLDSLLNVYNL